MTRQRRKRVFSPKISMTMNDPVRDVTGVILAGGKSSRYGRNKALEEIDGVPIIERIIHCIGPIFPHVILITNSPEDYDYLGLPMQEDLIKGLGPLGGIFTALRHIPHEAGFFVACDMPFLNTQLIRYMVSSRGDHDAVVPRIGWKIEPLHALYSRQCLPAIQELIEGREYQILKFFEKIRVRYVNDEEIRAFDPRLKSFFNVNRPEELSEAIRL